MSFRHPPAARWLVLAIFFLGIARSAAASADDALAALRAYLGAGPPPAYPARCLTPYTLEAHACRHEFSEAELDEIAALLSSTGLESTYVSPSGLFSLHYTTAGPDSVPIWDTNPVNGVPDYVERCGEYADNSWRAEVDTLGFEAPLLPVDGTYDILFRKLGSGVYGYASVDGPTTHIIVHSTFQGGLGWPGPTDDPDGDQLGRAKVTIAHEFKHASQFTNNGWTEGTWTELDAMWIEDLVYPFVNDYKYFVDNSSWSQLDAAWVALNNNGQGNYEDLLWQHYMSGTWGPSAIVQLWDRRALYPTEDMTASYAATLAGLGSNWAESYASYIEWCWFTGLRAETGFGFVDAADLWRMETMESLISAYPSSRAGTVPPLASHPRRYGIGASTGSPHIAFDATDDHDVELSIIVKRHDDSYTITRPELGSYVVYNETLADPWTDIHYLTILVTNGNPAAAPVSYTLDITDDTAVDVPAVANRVASRLHAFPNPTPGSVRFAFEAEGGAIAPLRIVDVGGRLVRRIAVPQGPPRFEISWDGIDASGRPAPAGVYWAVAETNSATLVQRVIVVR